jgi:predicted MFS family arabinose efflux permease
VVRTYRELFAVPEFRPLFWTSSVQVAAQTISGLALATLIFDRTRSPLLSALAMFGPSLTQLIGASTLLAAADRLPARALISGLSLAFGVSTAALAVPGLPVWAAFAILAVQGLGGSLTGAVRYGLLTDVLTADGYLLGRSVLNMAVGAMQIGGFAAGGILVLTLSPRGTLLTGAALFALGAVVARFGLTRRPPRAVPIGPAQPGRPGRRAAPAGRAAVPTGPAQPGRPGRRAAPAGRAAWRASVRDTWRVNRWLWSSITRRYIYLALWLPNGLIVGCESLFVSYAPRHAGLLFVCAAAGMLAGDTLAGRFISPRWRERLGAPLRLLLAAPYLVFAMPIPLPVAAVAIVLASVGYCASLVLQERLMTLTPDDMSGQALGLASSGMLAMQGVGATLAGVVAQLSSPGMAMAVMAGASLAITLTLAPGLRPAGPQGRGARWPYRTAAAARTSSGTERNH